MKRTVLPVVLAIFAVLFSTAAAQPAIEVTSHHDGETVKFSNMVLRGNASDPAGILSVNVSQNGGPWRTASGNESWSIPLDLLEGANVIVIVATSLENNSTTQTIVIDYSIGGSDNSGVLLAGVIIIFTVFIIVFVAMRFKRAPPPEEKAGPETIEERLEKESGKGKAAPGEGLPVDEKEGGPDVEDEVGTEDTGEGAGTEDREEEPSEEAGQQDEDLVTSRRKRKR